MSGKSWLDDDPEWRSIKQRVEAEAAHAQVLKSKRKQRFKNYALFVRAKAVGLYSSISRSISKGTYIKKQKYIVLTILVLVFAGGAFGVIRGLTKDDNPVADEGVLAQQDSGEKMQPEYDFLSVPEKKEDGSILYDAERKVTSFKDDIGGIAIIVSMQPLPGSFSSDPIGYVEKLAVDFNANEKITESSPVAFTGKNINGVQTTLFTKNELLVFIQAAQEIDRKDLASYITALD